MPRKVIDPSTNEEIEIPTEEELEKEREEREEEMVLIKEENEAKLSELQDELEKEKDKEKNFKNLKTKTKDEVETKEEENVNLRDELTAEFDKKLGDVQSKLVNSVKDKAIREVAGDDVDLVELIEGNYDKINSSEETDQDILNRVDEAVKLSDLEVDNAIDFSDTGVAAGGENVNPSASVGDISPELKEFGNKKMGLSDEVLEKYGPETNKSNDQ